MKITGHFSRSEMTTTQSGIENRPTLDAWINMTRLCCDVLEPLRAIVGALRVNSGYRSPEVNTAIGGANNSAHTYGRAADVVPLARDISALDVMAAAESHRFNIARTQILLCCDDAQPGLTGVMTEDEALQHVLSNVSEWEEELPEIEGHPPRPDE